MALDSVAVVGELMSWIGLGVGVPMLIVVRLLRASDRAWEAVDIAVLEHQGRLIARWFAAGAIHERPLRPGEAVRFGEGWYAGRASVRRADRVTFTSPSAVGPTLATLGGIFVAAGVIGFALSWLPVFA